jgi:Fe2+ or Zn2+ uptake regulation protein
MTKCNLRNTNQRKVILEALKKTKNHPTAIEIYDAVRDELPNISLGTVYRNLDVLHECGLIQKIYSGDSQMHFDALVNEHNHIRCIKCGKVRDISVALNVEYNMDNSELDRFEIFGHNIEFFGICSNCKIKEKNKN